MGLFLIEDSIRIRPPQGSPRQETIPDEYEPQCRRGVTSLHPRNDQGSCSRKPDQQPQRGTRGCTLQNTLHRSRGRIWYDIFLQGYFFTTIQMCHARDRAGELFEWDVMGEREWTMRATVDRARCARAAVLPLRGPKIEYCDRNEWKAHAYAIYCRWSALVSSDWLSDSSFPQPPAAIIQQRSICAGGNQQQHADLHFPPGVRRQK